MADENLEAPPETPSDASVPAEDVSETTSDEEGEADESTESSEEEAEEPETEAPTSDEAEEEQQEASAEDDEDEAWKNFNKKFNHLRSERDRKAAMGRAFWEKTRYASQLRKENEELKLRLAQGKPPARDEKPEEPAQPPPELARIEQRIQILYQKDQAYQAQQSDALMKLSAADKEVAIIEDKIKDADEYQKAILEQRMETAKIKRESILNRWADLNDKREAVSLEMEQRLTDRDWTQKFLKDRANREKQEQQSLEEFNVEFPKHVDALIDKSADDLGAPKDQGIRKSLWKSVNRAVMVDLWQFGEQGLDAVDVPALVRSHVKEYLEDRDLAGRKRFAKTSTEKLQVTSAARKNAPRPAPANKPVPPALLSQGDTSPAMRRARELLTKRFGG